MANSQPDVTIYTDGACTGNPGPGGYAAVLIFANNQRREISAGYSHTTNNRMELMAAISALSSLTKPSRVRLYSDSRYLVDAINQGWAVRWRANRWRRGKQRALNSDLWAKLLQLIEQHQVEFFWVAGHAGHSENEYCDRLAVAAASGKNLPPDLGYANEPPEPAQPNLF